MLAASRGTKNDNNNNMPKNKKVNVIMGSHHAFACPCGFTINTSDQRSRNAIMRLHTKRCDAGSGETMTKTYSSDRCAGGVACMNGISDAQQQISSDLKELRKLA